MWATVLGRRLHTIPPFQKLNLHRCLKLFSAEEACPPVVIQNLFQDDTQRQCVVLKQVQDDDRKNSLE